MNHFLIKTVILMIALFVCVIYGMEVAKQNMMVMVGEKPDHSLSLAAQLAKPLSTPSVTGKNSSAASGSQHQTTAKSSDSSVQKTSSSTNNSSGNSEDELSKRIKKLETIQDFNPYSSLGIGLSNGFQKTFMKGMTATTNLFGHLIKNVF